MLGRIVTGDASLKNWLYKIATNLCLNELRRPERLAGGIGIAVTQGTLSRDLDELVDVLVRTAAGRPGAATGHLSGAPRGEGG